jgi:hypothetical protein
MTDFRLFYEVLNDPDGQQFDVQRIVENGGRGDPRAFLPSNKDFSLDNYPQVCLGCYLSESETLVNQGQASAA